MANSPQSSYINLDFRAPPPSPVASGRRSSVANDAILTEFLHHSLRVPDLVLPDRVFPRQNSKIQNLPKLDFETLDLNLNGSFDEVTEKIAQIGCFELVNHGISGESLSLVVKSGAGVFRLSPEKKAVVSRSVNSLYGFVEFHGDQNESSEEFVWCRDDSLKSKMEDIWPDYYSNFSEKMENTMSEIENISETLLKLFLDDSTIISRSNDDYVAREKESAGSICYIYKHCPDAAAIPNDDHMNSLRYDVIRMLIRGSEHPHTLCFHVCDGSSEFHVYSKKGWVSFSPDYNALIVTIGDQLQTWSKGKYKHVIGRPIFKGKLDACVSMAFLYSPQSQTLTPKGRKDKLISFGHQFLLFLILIFLYNLFS